MLEKIGVCPENRKPVRASLCAHNDDKSIVQVKMNYFECIQFIVKRAFRRGHCVRRDVCRAFGMTESTATRRMSDALARHGNVLIRRGPRIEPKPLAKPPLFAGESALLQDLDGGHPGARTTGLFEDELPVTRVRWLECTPPTPGNLMLLTRAVIDQMQVGITYLGVREREEPETRHVLPLGLEQMGDQWRLIVIDADIADGDPVRTLVLARILAVDTGVRQRRMRLPPHGHHDGQATFQVHLSSQYSAKQREVLSRELGVHDGGLRVPERSAFEFLRRFSIQAPSPNAVWPPISHFERIPPITKSN
jgi:hypothetical protein